MNLYQKISHGRKFYVFRGFVNYTFFGNKKFLVFFISNERFIHFKKSKAIDERKMTPGRKLTQEPETAYSSNLGAKKNRIQLFPTEYNNCMGCSFRKCISKFLENVCALENMTIYLILN